MSAIQLNLLVDENFLLGKSLLDKDLDINICNIPAVGNISGTDAHVPRAGSARTATPDTNISSRLAILGRQGLGRGRKNKTLLILVEYDEFAFDYLIVAITVVFKY
jgi:hypothetical protein